MQDLVEVRQGRSFNSHGPSRSAIEARSDPRRHLKSTVAGDMADVLAVELEAGRHRRLVLVAAPATMGDLRCAVTQKVRAAVVSEVTLDLTKTPNDEVAVHLKDVLYAM
jgi:protein required for attachment to host cells